MSPAYYLSAGFVLGYAIATAVVLYAVNRAMKRNSGVPTLSLRGWFCLCGIFNGEEKELRQQCRTCSRSREYALKHQRQNLTRIGYLGDGTQ